MTLTKALTIEHEWGTLGATPLACERLELTIPQASNVEADLLGDLRLEVVLACNSELPAYRRMTREGFVIDARHDLEEATLRLAFFAGQAVTLPEIAPSLIGATLFRTAQAAGEQYEFRHGLNDSRYGWLRLRHRTEARRRACSEIKQTCVAALLQSVEFDLRSDLAALDG